MIRPGTPSARAICAAAVGLSITALAVAAHVVAHGDAPPLLALIPLVVLMAAATYAIARSRVSLPGLLALVGGAQLAIHALSGYLAGPNHHTASADATALMAAAHVVSTLVTAVALAYGEQLWWQVDAWLRSWRGAQPSTAAPFTWDRWTFFEHRFFAPAGVCQFAVGTRGPPA